MAWLNSAFSYYKSGIIKFRVNSTKYLVRQNEKKIQFHKVVASTSNKIAIFDWQLIYALAFSFNINKIYKAGKVDSTTDFELKCTPCDGLQTLKRIM